MFLLHAAVCNGEFVLWAEHRSDGEVRPSRRGGRRPKRPQPAPFPYDAAAATLCRHVAAAVPGLDLRPAQTAARIAWLPGTAGQPVPSSPLIAAAPPADAPLAIAPWTVTTCGLGWGEVIDLLGACLDRPALAPGTLIGADLAYWATAMRFAATLATRQRFLPGLVTAKGRTYARWEPVCFDADAERLTRLAAAMPGACRAVTPTGVTAPPESSAREQLVTFITLLIDHLARTANGAAAGAGPPRRNQAQATGDFPSLHDQWVHALTTPDGQLHGRAPDLVALAEQVRSWRRPIAMLQAAPFRLCFRLEEPGAPDAATGTAPSGQDGVGSDPTDGPDAWPVRYLLQAVDDPSLMLPVADAWHARGAQARIFRERGVHAREFILAALGQAAQLAPAIGQSLQQAPPAGYTLGGSGAHAFLTETAPALEQAGFRVLLPAWWTGQGSRLRLGVRARVASPGLQAGQGLSLDQVLDVDWQVALGDATGWRSRCHPSPPVIGRSWRRPFRPTRSSWPSSWPARCRRTLNRAFTPPGSPCFRSGRRT